MHDEVIESVHQRLYDEPVSWWCVAMVVCGDGGVCRGCVCHGGVVMVVCVMVMCGDGVVMVVW